MKLNFGSGDVFINGKWAGHIEACEAEIRPHSSFEARADTWADIVVEDPLDADEIG